MLGTVYSLLPLLSGFRDRAISTEEYRDAVRQRDPVHKERMRQAEYDWQLARQESRKRGTVGLGEQLTAGWRALTAAAFRERFVELEEKIE